MIDPDSRMDNKDIRSSLQSSDLEIIEIIAEPFLENFGSYRNELIEVAETGDLDGLERVSLVFKGVVGHFGMKSLERTLGEIARKAQCGQIDSREIDQTVVILDTLERELRCFIANFE